MFGHLCQLLNAHNKKPTLSSQLNNFAYIILTTLHRLPQNVFVVFVVKTFGFGGVKRSGRWKIILGKPVNLIPDSDSTKGNLL